MKIYILASERSGSNLLRTLIGNHREVCAPVAPHLFRTFYRMIELYGDLKIESNKEELLRDILKLVNHEYHSWNLSVDVISKALKLVELNGLAKIIDFFYLQKSNMQNKEGYCCKGIHNFEYAHYIKNEMPNAKFIYLIRDPRDVTASWLKTPLKLHTAFRIAKIWDEQQLICRRFKACYPDDVYLLRYEDLIADTIGSMSKVQEFLGLDMDEKCFSTDSENTEAKSNEFWKNLNKPVIKGNSSKFLESLSAEQIKIIETITKENMTFAGYDNFFSEGDWTPGNQLVFKIKERFKISKSKRNRGEATRKVLASVDGKIEMIKAMKKRLRSRKNFN